MRSVGSVYTGKGHLVRSMYWFTREGLPQPMRMISVGMGAEERFAAEGVRDCLRART